jgi:Tol biopolymer transport system component
VACVAVWAGRSPAAFPGHNGRIVFQRKLPGGLEIFTMRSDGSDQHQLTHDPRNFDPSYSASGKRIAFDSYRDGDDEIFVMSPDGSHLHQVTHNSVGDALADISPNGRKILSPGSEATARESTSCVPAGRTSESWATARVRSSRPMRGRSPSTASVTSS